MGDIFEEKENLLEKIYLYKTSSQDLNRIEQEIYSVFKIYNDNIDQNKEVNPEQYEKLGIIIPTGVIKSFQHDLNIRNPLRQFKNLTMLSINILSCNKIGVIGAFEISDGLKSLQYLQYLSLNIHQNEVGIEGAKALGQGIQTLVNLNTFKFIIGLNNNIQEDGISYFTNGYKNLFNLQNLSINIYTGNDIKSQGAIYLGDNLTTLKNLINLEITLGDDQISELGTKGIAEGIKQLEILEILKIKLYSNNIQREGAQQLGKGISFLNNLSELIIHLGEGNSIQAEGFQGIIVGIGQLKKLKYLEIDIWSNNFITSQGFIGFQQSMKSLQYLEYLNMQIRSSNGIKLEGIKYFYRGVKELKQLKKLLVYFQDEEIEKGNGNCISQGIKNLQNLQYLKIQIGPYNQFNESEINQLILGIEKLVNINTFSIYLSYGNPLTEQEYQTSKRNLIKRAKRIVKFIF